ncbi:MAG: signal peptidase I [Eubacteriales bacterium]|jgi:signal peptidase I
MRSTKDDRDNSEKEYLENDNKKSSVKKEILSYVRLIVIVAVVMILLQKFIIVNAKIPSESMEPTIMTGDQIFGNRLAYVFGEVQRYDIIIFKYPDNEDELFIKRVIGLPGDTVDIHDGDVYINGDSIPLSDDFCATPDSTAEGNLEYPITVPDGCYFVLGDNREYSHDARYWENTFVSEDEILGKAVFRYWPFTRFGFINSNEDEYYEPVSSGS